MRNRLVLAIAFLLATAAAASAGDLKAGTYSGAAWAPGTTFALPIEIRAASNVNVFQVVLHYDPSVLIYSGFTVSTWFNSGSPYLVLTSVDGPAPYYDPVTETFSGYYVNISGVRMDGSGVSVGSTTWETLITINFTVAAVGSSYLDLVTDTTDTTGCALLNTTGGSLPLTLIDGSFTNDVPIHDLAVSAVAGAPATVTQGATITISVTAANQGTVSESVSINLTRSGTAIATISGTLPAGATSTYSYAWSTSGVAPGTYVLAAAIPPVVGETDTADNSATGTSVTINPAPVHDIAVTAVGASPTSFEIGGSTTISFTIANQGNVTDSFTANLVVGGSIASSVPSTPLAAGATWSGSFTFTPPAPGAYSIAVAVPPIAGETDTADNTMSGPALSVSAPPVYDIAITAFSATPSSGVAGAPVTFSMTFTNQGNTTVALPSWTIATSDAVLATGPGGASIAAGASLTVTAGWTSAAGTLDVAASVAALAGETDLADNGASLTVAFVPPVHDVAVTAVTASPTSATQGDPVSLAATIANEGNVSESFVVVFTANGVAVASAPLTLAAGASASVSGSWDTTGEIAGSWVIEASIATLAGETDTADNTMLGPTVALSGPVYADLADLNGKSAWPEHHHYDLTNDEDAYQTLFAKVKNLGTNPVYCKVRFELYVGTTLVGTYWTSPTYLAATGVTSTQSFALDAAAAGVNDYRVWTKAFYASSPDGPWTEGIRLKKFSFSIVD
jgi:hypothetical protein